ncbi:MAG: hypothetical protein JWM11_51 [Planctomycetaceae bacterium]|nr:hypothetical protein [Planctomycetaceae bacterium]
MSSPKIHLRGAIRAVICGILMTSIIGETLIQSEAVCGGDDPPVAKAREESKSAADSSTKITPKESAAEPAKELFSGKVVLLPEVLKRRGIKATDEMKGQAVLETDSGEIWPLISDWRGRAFFQDERLRNRKVELVARRHQGLPYLQVLMVFTFNEQGERQYTDYWCDICSIPMYEIKDCDCCRGPIRLRFQKQNLPEYLKKTKAD